MYELVSSQDTLQHEVGGGLMNCTVTGMAQVWRTRYRSADSYLAFAHRGRPRFEQVVSLNRLAITVPWLKICCPTDTIGDLINETIYGSGAAGISYDLPIIQGSLQSEVESYTAEYAFVDVLRFSVPQRKICNPWIF